MPISEAGFTGAGVGAAMNGMSPIVEIMFCDFVTLACDQIVNQAAKIHYMFGGTISVPLVIRAPVGGYISMAAQHSQMFEAWFSHVPGLKVVLPSTPYDAKGLLKSAIRDDNPVMYFDHKRLGGTIGEVPEEDYTLPIGKADIKRPGKDVTIVAYSYMVSKSLEAATELSKNDIDVEVIDLRSTLPIDEKTVLASVKKTGKLVIVQETYAPCSVSSEIAALVAEKGFQFLNAPIKRVYAKWAPIPFAENLENDVLPQRQDIITAVEEIA
jgi:pyruvate/2-oxoglutarate/acetoin dehydrogenase E1 component